MINTDDLDVTQVLDTYVVSNTPGYLYKNLLKAPLVQKLAQSLSVDELMTIYNRIAQLNDRTAREVALAYAALVAVTLKDYRDARRAFNSLSSRDLDWAPYIIQRFFSRPVSSTISKITPNQGAITHKLSSSSSSISNTSALITHHSEVQK